MRSATTLLAIISSIWQTLTKSHGQKPCLTGEPDASKGCTSGSGRGGQERTCKGNALAAYFTRLVSFLRIHFPLSNDTFRCIADV